MDISVAPLMDQRNVEDCPGSMVEGSAVKLAITGAAWDGGAVTTGAGGGGGGGGGTFLAQPAANNASATNIAAPNLEACNLELSLILRFSSWWVSSLLLCCFTPNRFFVIPLRSECLRLAAVGQHGVNLRCSSALGREHQ